MSYGVSEALQRAIFDRLTADAALAGLGAAVHDTLPEGGAPELYVALGPERVRDRSDATGAGALHDVAVSVVAAAGGFAAAKAAATAVSDALADADLALARGRLVSLRFLRARAGRAGDGAKRRIDLTFRARVED